MRFRRFNDLGIRAFAAYLEALRANPSAPIPRELLDRPNLTAPLEPAINADPPHFNTRMEFARWLHEAAQQAGTEIPRRDAGFWAWLTLALFDSVCPSKNGKRKCGEDARYIPASENWRRRYRHLLATPYTVFLIHIDRPERAAFILNSPLHVLGELTEQFASRQDLVSCPGTMSLVSYLFSDAVTGQRRSNAAGNAARRLGKLLNQYQRTWDITIMDPTAFANMLPREFERFRQAASMGSSGSVG